MQKLVEREAVVRKTLFSEYLKSEKAKKDYIGFVEYFSMTAADAIAKPELQTNPIKFDHFMADHRGFALEDAFRGLFTWLIANRRTPSQD